MSCIVKITPFINRELLLAALNKTGCKYTLSGSEIITGSSQKFVFENGYYQLKDESWYEDHDIERYIRTQVDIDKFLSALAKAYLEVDRRKRAEAERIRREQERLRQEKIRLEQERIRLEKEQLAEEERRRLEAERKRQEQLIEQERLRVEAERKRVEEERLRIERERQEFVEKQRATVIAKAKEKGYSVHEQKAQNKIKIVLVRQTY